MTGAIRTAISLLVVFGFSSPALAGEFAGVVDSLSGNREDTSLGEANEPLGEEEKEEARHHFTTGKARFEAGEYREAAEHFRRAYELTHAPELLYNLGRCHEELEETGRARESYELYLRMSPDAKDAEEVRARIDALEEDDDAADAKDAKDEAEGDGGRKVRAGIRLQIDMGLSVPLLGEWDRKAIPVDFQLHFPLASWVYLAAGLLFGGFAGDDSSLNGYPRSEFGLYVAVVGAWDVSKRVVLLARVAFAPTWIFRVSSQENAVWLDAQGGLGVAVRLVGAWAITAEAIGGFGPVFVPKARTGDLWKNDGISPSADIGGRVGVLYTF